MKTLHLNLKKKWFDMILSGEKTEEYRDITEYWVRSLINPTDEGVTVQGVLYAINHPTETLWINDYFEFKDFDTITFSNGYSKNRPQFVIEFKGLEIREGNPEWGAEPEERYFVLKLGDLIKCQQKMHFTDDI